jgi:HSP20 family protein
MTRLKEKEGQVVPKVSRDLTPFEEMDRLFSKLFEGGLIRPFEWTGMRHFEEQMPRVDVIDREGELVVKAQLPGVRKEDVDISLSDEYLTIKGKTHEEKEEKGAFYRAEIRHGSFSRTIHLPSVVNAEKAEAGFDKGVLEIRLPKIEQIRKHKVPIK